MSNPDPPPPQPRPWDLLGDFFTGAAAATANIADRNLGALWSATRPDAGPYTAARLEADWASWAKTRADDARDAWSVWAGIPHERCAYPLPTAYLEFDGHVDEFGSPSWALCEPIVIPVAWAAVAELPAQATIELGGGDPAGASNLLRSLRTRLAYSGMAYTLESYDVRDLVPGVYTGMVCIQAPSTRPIADLRIVVRGPAAAEPELPIVGLRWGATPMSGEPATSEAHWTISGPTRLPAPGGVTGTVEIALSGEHGAELARSLTITPDASGTCYRLQATAPPAPDVRDGYYVGSVFACSPRPRTLASLEVTVDARRRGSGADE